MYNERFTGVTSSAAMSNEPPNTRTEDIRGLNFNTSNNLLKQNINNKIHPSPRDTPYLDTSLMETNQKGTYIAIDS
jgi:hypothetical protein